MSPPGGADGLLGAIPEGGPFHGLTLPPVDYYVANVKSFDLGQTPIPAPTLPAVEQERIEPAPAPEPPPAKPEPPPVPRRVGADLKEVLLDRDVNGIRGITRVVGRWGFQGKALWTDVRVDLPVPRKGLADLLDATAFSKRRLPPIPKGVGAFSVMAFRPGTAYSRFLRFLQTTDPPNGAEEFTRIEEAVRVATGLRLRGDVMNHLGPTWTVLALPSALHDGTDFNPIDFGLLVEVDDAEFCGKALDTIARWFNESIRAQDGANAGDPPIIAIERLKPPDRGSQLTSPAGLVPWLGQTIRPTVLIGKSFIAIASTPDRTREALSGESGPAGRWEPTGELVEAFDRLPESLAFLSVGDSRASAWPDTIVGLPATVQFLSSLVGDVDDSETLTLTNLLAAIGVPRPGGFRVRIAPALVPKVDDLKTHNFPSVMAIAAVDDRGFRLIAREALPLACLGESGSLKMTTTLNGRGGLKRDAKLSLKFGSK